MKINQILIIQRFNQNCIVAHFGHTRAKYVFLNLPSKRKSLALFLLVKKYICSLVTKYICSCFLKQENVLVVKIKIKSLFLQNKCFSVLNFLIGKTITESFSLAETKQEIFLLWKTKHIFFSWENSIFFRMRVKMPLLQKMPLSAFW